MIGVPPYSPGDYLDVDEDDEGRHDPPRRPLPAAAAAHAGRRSRVARRGPRAARRAGLRPGRAARDRARQARARARASRPRRRRRRADQLAAVRDAAADTRASRSTTGRPDATSSRRARIDPEVVFFATGEWYVGAYCHRARDERMFRVDRIRAMRADRRDVRARRDRVREASSHRRRLQPTARRPAGHARACARSAAWVAEAYPTESVTERADGSLEIVLAVSEPAWLERLLLRLGPEARGHRAR